MAKDSTEVQLNKNGDKRGMSPNSRKNLDRGRKGNNFVKDCSITHVLKAMADELAEERWLEVEDKGKGFTWRQAVAKRIWIEAVRGNAKVTSELLDRLEGKVTQPIGTPEGRPFEVTVIEKVKDYGSRD